MSLKAKLVSTIAAICMVICLLSVGVWAASTVTVGLTGSVSFVSNDVQAVVKGRIDGTTNDTAEGQYVNIATFDARTTDTDNGETADFNEAKNQTWSIGDLVFKDKTSTITITIIVENKHDSHAINATFAPTLAEQPIVKDTATEVKVGENSTNVMAYYTTTETIAQGASSSGTYTIVLSIKDKNLSVSKTVATIGGSLTLNDPSVA